MGDIEVNGELPDLSIDNDFLSIDRLEQKSHKSNYDTLADECVVLIESVKSHVLGIVGISPSQQDSLFLDLDRLRGLFHQLVSSINSNDSSRAQVVSNRKPANLGLLTEGVVGRSEKVRKIFEVIEKFAPTDITLLLEGETGVGKELLARIIHTNSGLGKFVAVNCGAFPAGTIESELFGHVKGAYTGAHNERKGKFQEANGGTIFLDEIGELDLLAQVKMLRVLEVGEVQKVGSDDVAKTNVRVVAATNRNLEQMVADGSFREDLYYRLNMSPIMIPPLRERRDEIGVLFEHFTTEICEANGKSKPKIERSLEHFILDEYEFPGNIRELKNLAQFIALFYTERKVKLSDIPERYRRDNIHSNNKIQLITEQSSLLGKKRDGAERELIENMLIDHKGQIKPIYTTMNISRSRLYQLLKKYDLKASNYK